MSVTSVYIECATGKWYHSIELTNAFLQRPQLPLYERSFELKYSILVM